MRARRSSRSWSSRRSCRSTPTARGRAGDATFHAGWTLHRAGPNPTELMRPVMTVIYFADGARVSEPDSAYQRFDLSVWLPGCEVGDLAASPINPLLWPTNDSPRSNFV